MLQCFKQQLVRPPKVLFRCPWRNQLWKVTSYPLTWHQIRTLCLKILVVLEIICHVETMNIQQLSSWSRALPEEANRSEATQVIPPHFIETKVSLHILSQISPVRSFPCHFLKTHFNIILPTTSRSSKRSVSRRSPHHKLLCTSPVHVTCTAHLFLPDLIT
jgi:hypothetical protein